MLGTVPDFTHEGPGVRIDDVVSGSAAEKVGLRTGDLLLAIDGKLIDSLRAYAEVLRTLEPGDGIVLTVERNSEEIIVSVKLEAR